MHLEREYGCHTLPLTSLPLPMTVQAKDFARTMEGYTKENILGSEFKKARSCDQIEMDVVLG